MVNHDQSHVVLEKRRLAKGKGDRLSLGAMSRQDVLWEQMS